jgi:uroporphyrinogen decarboxylase
MALVEDDVLKALEVDTRGLLPKSSSTWKFETTEDAEYIYYTDEWGMKRRIPKENGRYFDLSRHPLEEAETPEDIAKYPWPNPTDPARFEGLEDEAQNLRKTGAAVILGGICAGMLEVSLWMRGFENFYTDLLINKPVAEAMLDKILEMKLKYWGNILPKVKDNVDIAMEGDDLGMQNSLLVSPDVYRTLIKPRQRQLFSFIKQQADVHIFFHTCGSVYEIIPDLIEVGVDILNPVQVSAARMDTKQLKKEFGRDIVFWGGGVDTQRILPRGTPQEVRDEVKRRIEDLAPGGGFVFNTVHNIQADVPPQNIIAMWETLRE